MPAATVKKPHVKRLDLQHNSIAFVPDTIDRLTCLTHIDLSHNSLDELPAQVSSILRLPFHTLLPQLLMELQHNSIAFVPDTIDRLTCLTHIDLSHISLNELPAQVSSILRLTLHTLLPQLLMELFSFHFGLSVWKWQYTFGDTV